MPNKRFVKNETYRRRDLHDEFGGQRQGGISTPSRHDIILLFTGESGHQHGYRDGWSKENVFNYTGEGQRGDMQFKFGNKALRDHVDARKELHLFEQAKKGYVRYVGQMECIGFHLVEASDTRGRKRQAIVFELREVSC
jgi:5-methylcytosine-specific restriction enzyme A